MTLTQDPVRTDVLSILRALPGCHLFLQPDAPSYTIIEATDAYLQATLSGRFIVGKPLFEVFPDNPSLPDATGVKNLSSSLSWVLEHKKTHHMSVQRYDVPASRKSNFVFKVWKPTNKPVMDAKGEVQYIIHTVEDITEQVQSSKGQEGDNDVSLELERQRLLTNTILSASHNVIYALEAERDKDHRITDYRYLFANHATANYLKKSIDEIVGATMLGLIPENKANGFFDYFCTVLEKGQPDRQQTYFSSRHFKGWFDFTVMPVSKDVIIVTVQDITEMKESQVQLQQTVAELKRSNRNLEEFAHAASHDLKEPVRKIHYFTQHLKEQLQPRLQENELRSFGRIEKSTERMSRLIDDLLLYSHVSLHPVEKETVDLNETVRQVLEDLEVDIQLKNAKLHVGSLPRLPGYRRQLQQLFQNLISNALKYSKPGPPPEITISSWLSDSRESVYQVIEISDNGIGFEQQYSEKIFQMFARLHGNTEYSGTGVGLAIARKVIENHDGFVEVTSAPGKGASFKVYLPAD
ncbi:MAG TPA: ATP-binding protein [Flavisolibacter sp.]|jgi:signal transduction histidine kinase|nr:ATP-binding protein [Flavisolibacter sp.]